MVELKLPEGLKLRFTKPVDFDAAAARIQAKKAKLESQYNKIADDEKKTKESAKKAIREGNEFEAKRLAKQYMSLGKRRENIQKGLGAIDNMETTVYYQKLFCQMEGIITDVSKELKDLKISEESAKALQKNFENMAITQFQMESIFEDFNLISESKETSQELDDFLSELKVEIGEEERLKAGVVTTDEGKVIEKDKEKKELE